MGKPACEQACEQGNRARNARYPCTDRLWLEIIQSLSNRLKFSASPSAESPYHGSNSSQLGSSLEPGLLTTAHGGRDQLDPPSTLIFVVSEKVVFSKDTCRTKQGGGQGRVERVQEMGEPVETVVGWGIQVPSSFHTDVKELEYQDLLTSTFTQTDHERGMKNWGAKDGYTQCVF